MILYDFTQFQLVSYIERDIYVHTLSIIFCDFEILDLNGVDDIPLGQISKIPGLVPTGYSQLRI